MHLPYPCIFTVNLREVKVFTSNTYVILEWWPPELNRDSIGFLIEPETKLTHNRSLLTQSQFGSSQFSIFSGSILSFHFSLSLNASQRKKRKTLTKLISVSKSFSFSHFLNISVSVWTEFVSWLKLGEVRGRRILWFLLRKKHTRSTQRRKRPWRGRRRWRSQRRLEMGSSRADKCPPWSCGGCW